jgi:REP element-mobilizing transposase RayT
MRIPRFKINSASDEAVYHCMSRTVNGERLLDEAAREVFRKQLWLTAEFCGVQVITHAILSNHFHVLVRVPLKTPVPDAELLRRYRLLHPKPTAYQLTSLETIAAQLATDSPEAVLWRRRQTLLMNDVSQFLKLLKQRFSIWFNSAHARYGPLWSDRFKSVLVESKPRVLEIMSAYIDLNAVRAGLVKDPKDYRFCGYGEAVGGNNNARAGLCLLLGAKSARAWGRAQSEYRLMLYGTGAAPRNKSAGLSEDALKKVVEDGGQLTLAEALRCRLRYFTEGVALGSQTFVNGCLAGSAQRFRRKKNPSEIPAVAEWGTPLTILRPPRRQRQAAAVE